MKKYDPNNPQHVEDARLEASLGVQSHYLAVKELLQNKSARGVIWQWLSLCGIYQTSLHPSGSMVYANEGRREIGLKILKDIIAADPDMFLQMMKDNKQEM